jgi:ribosomal protein L16 Arg81 hydroxylase
MLNKNIIEIIKSEEEFYHFNHTFDSNLINWIDVARFFMYDFTSNVELIGPKGKINIPTSNDGVQDKSFVVNKINENHSFVISKFKNINNQSLELYDEFCECYPNNTVDFHLYGGLTESSYTFPAHNDLASNFIIQLDGECEWIIYKEQATYDEALNYKKIPEEELTISYETTLKPGDILYIPSGKYHKCIPLGKRLSLSIPIL